ncbi:hypothetical protein NDU88_003417 [Pleurodeles waltl]|uniref:Uncharacterized protein n=1 Tax=Pleurodeles waltl TaxID=8319 RepID=A0AAV7WPC6_PLEWA|nr:hypothetical protein NDU88_003417 [Pleurodeles waltl]
MNSRRRTKSPCQCRLSVLQRTRQSPSGCKARRGWELGPSLCRQRCDARPAGSGIFRCGWAQLQLGCGATVTPHLEEENPIKHSPSAWAPSHGPPLAPCAVQHVLAPRVSAEPRCTRSRAGPQRRIAPTQVTAAGVGPAAHQSFLGTEGSVGIRSKAAASSGGPGRWYG